MNRLIMNTTSLQKEFPDVYKKFFSEHDLVISWCNSFSRWSTISHSANLPRIKQKVPTKTYCWFVFNNTWEIRIKNVYSFNKNSFEELDAIDVNKNKKELEKFLSEHIKNKWFEKWIDINFLSENPRWHGFGFAWATWAIIATALNILNSKDHWFLEDYKWFSESPLFDKIYSLWREIEKTSRYGNATWSNCYSCLSNTNLPLIYVTAHDKKKVYKSDMVSFFELQDHSIHKLPIDYGIIYSWFENKTEEVHYVSESNERTINETKDFVFKHLKKQLNKDDFTRIFKNDFYDPFIDVFSILNFHLLKSFNELLQAGFDDRISSEFISNIDSIWNFFTIAERWNHFMSHVKNIFDKYKKIYNEEIWLCPIVTWKLWWWYIFVLKHNKSRETIIKVVEELKASDSAIFLEYASWIDWDCADWIKIEQYISKSIFSKYINKNNVLCKNNFWETSIVDYNKTINSSFDGLLLDAINGKIYLNGEKLTSKEIHSQTTTIDILEKLMENPWRDISNDELSVSSYSKNKNEMLGKIVLPLIKFLEKETWKKLPLICKWSIYDFYIKLNPTTIPITIIKTI